MSEIDTEVLYIKQRKVKQWTVILLFLLVLTVCIRMRLDDVTVQGNSTYTAEQAEELVFSDYWDRNTVLCIYRNLTKKKKSLPFVEDYKIVVKGPFSCELRFYEKKPIGCIRYLSNYMYFDKDGIMIESSSRRLDGIPTVDGLRFGYIVLGKKLPVDSTLLLNSIMSITQQLSLYEIGCDSIEYNDRNNTVTAVLEGGDIEVFLGTDNDLAAKISVLNDMLPEIQKRGIQGTLDLSSYNDQAKGSISSFKLKNGSKIMNSEGMENGESGDTTGDDSVVGEN